VPFGGIEDFAEEANLAAFAIALHALAGFHGRFHGGPLLAARALLRVHRARLDQAFDHAAVDAAEMAFLFIFVACCREGPRSLAGKLDAEFQVDATRLFLEDLNLKVRVFEAFNCLWKQQ
jgi:hypothetical protein